MNLKPLPVKELPKSPPLKKLIGPSFIILGLGLGSGELILWPYLTSNYGMGIIWGAVLGITFQFVMNMEIERYALTQGESMFVGFARKLKWLPIWFILSTFIPWIWPGIIASAAQIVGSFFGWTDTKWLTIGLLFFIGLVLSLGPVLYKTVEKLQKFLIIVGVPTIFILAIVLAKATHWEALFQGIIGKGDGYLFLPAGIPIATFLAALAYAGAGGNLNLAQSYYIREKGYGMGKYAGKIKSLLYGKQEDFDITGNRFEPTEENLSRFKVWWKNINREHLIVFWLTGAVTMLLLGLMSYATTFGEAGTSADINFLFIQAREIGVQLFPFAGTFFLIIAALTLFGTQLGVFDATSRILSENMVLASKGKFTEKNIPKLYYGVLWAQILAGVVILLVGFTKPLQLIMTAAVLNAVAMFVHTGLTMWVNTTLLDKKIQPNFGRMLMMGLACVLYGGFGAYILIDKLF